MPAETRYFRSDTWTVNGVTYRKLALTQTATSDYGRLRGSPTPLQWGIRVWKRSAAGVETEITAGEPVAIVSRTADGEGIQSAEYVCPYTSLNSTDSIIVRVYGRFGTGAWALFTRPPIGAVSEFTTEQLGAQSLYWASWTVYYYTYAVWSEPLGLWEMRFYWDSTSYPSRIFGFAWEPAPPVWGGNTHHVQMAKTILGL